MPSITRDLDRRKRKIKKAREPTKWWGQAKRCATQLDNCSNILHIIDGDLASSRS